MTTWPRFVLRSHRRLKCCSWEDGNSGMSLQFLLHAGFHNMQRVKIGKRRTGADCRLLWLYNSWQHTHTHTHTNSWHTGTTLYVRMIDADDWTQSSETFCLTYCLLHPTHTQTRTHTYVRWPRTCARTPIKSNNTNTHQHIKITLSITQHSHFIIKRARCVFVFVCVCVGVNVCVCPR